MGGVDRSGVVEKRRVLADLHVHVGRAAGGPVKITASPRLTPAAALEESSDRKGLDAVAVVDAHSPRVLADLDRLVRSGELEPLPGGGLRRSGERPLLLLLASEVEVVEHGLGPVHYLCYLPDLDTALGFSGFLSGRVTNVALGSPRARSSGEELARWVGREGGFLVPAHVFTPHKGYFGQGGRDLSRHLSDRALEAIPAVELGLSADTAMAEAVPSLGPFTFLSNSDAHSPETIAREHNALMVGEPRPAGPAAGEGSNPPAEMDFQTLFSAVRDGRVAANYGLDPRLGKYHRAFCPRCGFRADLAGGARMRWARRTAGASARPAARGSSSGESSTGSSSSRGAARSGKPPALSRARLGRRAGERAGRDGRVLPTSTKYRSGTCPESARPSSAGSSRPSGPSSASCTRWRRKIWPRSSAPGWPHALRPPGAGRRPLISSPGRGGATDGCALPHNGPYGRIGVRMTLSTPGECAVSFIGQFRGGLKGYLSESLPYYFFVGLLFVIGVSFGALAVNALTPNQKAELLDYMQVFLRGLGRELGGMDSGVVLRQSAANNLKTAGLIWLLGATVVGAPLALVIIFVRGFVIGFSVAFLFSEMGARGLALSVLCIFPQNLVAVPAVLAVGVSSLAFAVLAVRQRVGRFRVNLAEEFLAYTFTCLVLAALLVGASLIEAYVTPMFMAFIAGIQ